MKVYQKPEVKIEIFSLSESVASSCSWIQEEDKYINEDMGIVLFNNGGCNSQDGEVFCITNAIELIGGYTFTSG